MKALQTFEPALAQAIIDITEDGNALEVEGALDEALASYEKAWHLLPIPKTGWTMLSAWVTSCFYGVYFTKQDFKAALEWGLLELESRDSVVDVGPWMDLGKVYFELGEQDIAFSYFQKAFEIGKSRVFKEEPKHYYKFFTARYARR